MRLLRFLASSLLATTTVFAAKSSGDRYKENISKSQPIKLNDASFKTLTSAPRDYAVAVLLTAMGPQFGCTMCREFDPDWDLLARTWTKAKTEDSRIVFGTLDFVDGKNTFQAVRCVSRLDLLKLLADLNSDDVANGPSSPSLPPHHWPQCQSRQPARSLRLLHRSPIGRGCPWLAWAELA